MKYRIFKNDGSWIDLENIKFVELVKDENENTVYSFHSYIGTVWEYDLKTVYGFSMVSA